VSTKVTSKSTFVLPRILFWKRVVLGIKGHCIRKKKKNSHKVICHNRVIIDYKFITNYTKKGLNSCNVMTQSLNFAFKKYLYLVFNMSLIRITIGGEIRLEKKCNNHFSHSRCNE